MGVSDKDSKDSDKTIPAASETTAEKDTAPPPVVVSVKTVSLSAKQ